MNVARGTNLFRGPAEPTLPPVQEPTEPPENPDVIPVREPDPDQPGEI